MLMRQAVSAASMNTDRFKPDSELPHPTLSFDQFLHYLIRQRFSISVSPNAAHTMQTDAESCKTVRIPWILMMMVTSLSDQPLNSFSLCKHK